LHLEPLARNRKVTNAEIAKIAEKVAKVIRFASACSASPALKSFLAVHNRAAFHLQNDFSCHPCRQVFNTPVQNPVEKRGGIFVSGSARVALALCTAASAGTSVVRQLTEKMRFDVHAVDDRGSDRACP
jgi:hypothetical protein